jgi:hypothetical protein
MPAEHFCQCLAGLTTYKHCMACTCCKQLRSNAMQLYTDGSKPCVHKCNLECRDFFLHCMQIYSAIVDTAVWFCIMLR